MEPLRNGHVGWRQNEEIEVGGTTGGWLMFYKIDIPGLPNASRPWTAGLDNGWAVAFGGEGLVGSHYADGTGARRSWWRIDVAGRDGDGVEGNDRAERAGYGRASALAQGRFRGDGG